MPPQPSHAPEVITELPLEQQLALLAAPAMTPSGHFLTHLLAPQTAPIQMQRMPRHRSLKISIARLTAGMREGLWARRTWKQMESLWSRLHAYAAQRALPISDQTATLFVHDLDVAPTTKVGYASSLANLFRKMGLPSEVLRTYAQSQRGLGGARPTNQATPIPRAELLAIAAAQPTRLQVALLLAWKTASRWDDIARMTKRSLLSLREDEIIVDFGSETKTSRARPFRPEMLVVVKGDLTATIAAYLQRMLGSRHWSKDARLFPYPTSAIRELLRPAGYKAHSIKRGALTYVAQRMVGTDIPLHLVGVLARHAASTVNIAPVTLRYLQDVRAAARLIGTGSLTQLL
ncbi:hypothetical protein NESM_000931000 [Novymonas esmeraldas]|uniref:Integrase n=1 Tax=Novymonas esmeraldas TaxID=1808958 RepID=A0AAW0F2R5_9TRYP